MAQYPSDPKNDYWYITVQSIDGRIKLMIKSATIENILFWVHSRTFGRDIGRMEPYVDETGFGERLTLEIDLGEGVDWPDQETFEKGLIEALGLSFKMEKRRYPILILKDNN